MEIKIATVTHKNKLYIDLNNMIDMFQEMNTNTTFPDNKTIATLKEIRDHGKKEEAKETSKSKAKNTSKKDSNDKGRGKVC